MSLVNIPREVQEFLAGKLAWVATASASGEPSVTPKGSLKLVDSRHTVFADLFSNKTRRNLLENRRVAVTVVDTVSGKGYQLKGTAELLESSPLFEEACKKIPAMQRGLPAPRSVVQIGVDAVFDQSAGAEPCRQIA